MYRHDGVTLAAVGPRIREELERAIDAEPYDAAAYAVLGDLLQHEGDPRGELIALQLAAERAPFREHEAAAYLKRHAKTFVGNLASISKDAYGATFRWRFGFIHGLRVPSSLGGPNHVPMADALARVRAHPSGRFVTELAFEPTGFLDKEIVAAIGALMASPPPSLRHLHFGCVPRRDPQQNFWHTGTGLDGILSVVPQLRRLIVNGGQYSVGALDLPELRTLSFQIGGLNPTTARAIARARLPKITFLEVTGDHNDSIETLYVRHGRMTVSRTNGTFADIAPLLARTDLPALRHLGIPNALFTDEICAALPGSALLPQLEVLDLSHGFMTDDGARALAAHPEAFAHHHRLDVSKNYLTRRGIYALTGLARRVITKGQRQEREGE